LKFAPAEIAKWNEANAKLITGLVEQDLADLPGAIAQLKADGAELFEQIAPPEIAKELAKLSPADLIVIESDADWVPWELLAVDAKSDLLGERFVLVRSPIVKRGEELPPSAPKTVSPTLREALVIVGNDILNGADLPRQTFGDYAKRAKKPLEQPTWTELQTAVKGKDIVHFVCHGRGTKLYLDYGKDGGSKLLVKQASELGFDPGAVVFANACSSGTASPLLSSFQSFGKEFYLAGARPYIGTLGPVPQSLAVKFSALFYTRFALEGLSAADALRLARIDAAKTFKRPVWLLYCLYGNTSVTRRWSADA
jgi:CHAT domain